MVVDLKIDDEVNVLKGQWKGHTGRMTTVRPTYCSMLLLTDKIGNKVEGNIIGKVKRDFLEKKAPNPIEMPTADQLVLVDTDGFVEDEKVSSIDSLTDNLKEQLKTEAIQGIMTHETGVSEPAMTMDDAYCIRDERDKLRLQVQSMLGFQGTACSEIADLQLQVKKLKDELMFKIKECEDAVNHYEHDKLEKIRIILDQ